MAKADGYLLNVPTDGPLGYGYANANNDFVGVGSGGAGSYPRFEFNWEQARQDALTQLTPYYTQKLKEAGFDVERAKRLIEEDYKRGVRYSAEDVSRENTQADEDLATSLKGLGLDFAEEDRNLRGTLNNRGVLVGQMDPGSTDSAAPVSNYARDWHLKPMEERQGLRQLAVERAIKRQKEAAGITDTRQREQLGVTRNRGIEEQDIQYPRMQRDLEEEKREKAFNVLTPMKYTEAYSKYNAVNNMG